MKDLLTFENPACALSFYVEWQTDREADTRLSADCGEDYQETFFHAGLTTRHLVFVMGLWDGAQCRLTAQSTAAGGAEVSDTTYISVGPLPSYLPELRAQDLGQDAAAAVQPGWTLFNLNNDFDSIPLLVVMVDHKARYRWYHRVTGALPGSDNDVRTVAQGVLIGEAHGNTLTSIVSYEGSVIWQRSLGAHHHVSPVPGFPKVLRMLTSRYDCPGEMGQYRSGGMAEYDWIDNEFTTSWTLCQHYQPAEITGDWAHLNAVEQFPDGHLLVSSRNQDALFKVHRTTGEIIWKLGGSGDFKLADEDVFYQQHAPEIEPDGHILLFDNGSASVRPYSRVIELALNTDDMTAQVVWQFSPSPAIYAPIWGDADRLDNGDTLCVFGRRTDTFLSHIIEVDASAAEVWHLLLPPKWGTYRAQRVNPPPTGYVKVFD